MAGDSVQQYVAPNGSLALFCFQKYCLLTHSWGVSFHVRCITTLEAHLCKCYSQCCCFKTFDTGIGTTNHAMCRYVAVFNLHLKLLRDSRGLESLAQNIKGFYRSASSEASCSLPLRADYFFPSSLLSICREKWKEDQSPKENEKQAPSKSMRKKTKQNNHPNNKTTTGLILLKA